MKENHEFSKILKILQGVYSQENFSSESPLFPEKIKEILKKECPDPSLRKRLIAEFTDCGPLHSLIEDPLITEIIINGKDSICYETKGELQTLDDHFLSKWDF